MQKNLNNFQTQFSSSIICGIMFCFFLFLAVMALACGQKGNAAILPVIGALFAAPLYWRVRFDSDSATLFCFLFPRKIMYHEVKDIRCFFSNPAVPDAPASILFELKNGKTVRWELTLFSPSTRVQIKDALAFRLHLTAPEKVPASNQVQEWVKKISKGSKADKIILGIVTLFFLLFATFDLTTQLKWNERIRTWDQVDGVILKHSRKRVRSGKSTKMVSVLEYRYNYKDKVYTGNKIAYGSDTYPSWIKPGAIRKILVNPAKPAESAAMFTYRGTPGFFIRYSKTFIFGLIALITGIICYTKAVRKNCIVPEKLLRYMAENPVSETDVKGKKKKAVSHNIVLSGRPRWYQGRYLLLPGGIPLLFRILTTLPVLFVLPGMILGFPGIWIIFVVLGIFAAAAWLPKSLVFDMQEKKIYRCRFFKEEKLKKTKSATFADWRSLELFSYNAGKGGIQIQLTANDDSGNRSAVCTVPLSRLPLLLDMLPEFAEKLGKLPIALK